MAKALSKMELRNLRTTGLLNEDGPTFTEIQGAVQRKKYGGFCYTKSCGRELVTTNTEVFRCPKCKNALKWQEIDSSVKLK